MGKNIAVHPKYLSQKESILQLFDNFDQVGAVLEKGERNIIRKVSLEGTLLTIKKFKNPNVFQAIIYRFFRKSKARRSFEYANRLIDLNIKTPFPVAYFENFSWGLKESYYVCEYLAYDFDFRVLNHNPNWPYRKEILQQMAAFTFQLHEKGIAFLDHSPGNTLIVDTGNKKFDFYLIDLNRMHFGSLSLKRRMKNFRRLWLSKTMINIMAPIYASSYGVSSEEVHQLMTYYSRRFQKNVNAKKLRRKKFRGA